MGQGFFIDVDYEMKDSKMAADMTKKVIEWYRANVNAEANLTVVRSGGKGFHVIDFDYDIKKHLRQPTAQTNVKHGTYLEYTSKPQERQ